MKTYTTFDLAKLLDVYSSTIARWIDKGKLKAFVTPGGHRRITEEDLLKFLEKYNLPVPLEIKLERTKKILIVDDETNIVKILQRIIRKGIQDSEIAVAYDGFQAGQLFTNFQPDIVILDLMLSKMDGFELCKIIRQQNKKTRIIAITGFPTEINKKKIFECGANAFIAKPFENKDIIDQIKQLLKSEKK